MGKEEKKADLEQLLNSLIEKGWKPFGSGGLAPYVEIHGRDISFYKLCDDGMREWVFDTDIRAVLSIDSGLWQFVCENGMVSKHIEKICINPYNNDGKLEHGEYDYKDYQYWVMSCSLKDESELEDFLLSNIKVEGK